MRLIIFFTFCAFGVFAQQNSVFNNQPGVNNINNNNNVFSNTGFSNTGFSNTNTNLNTNINNVNGINTNTGIGQTGFQPQPGMTGPFQPQPGMTGTNMNVQNQGPTTVIGGRPMGPGGAGFLTPFGPFGPNGLPFGNTGIGGQVFGPRPGLEGPIRPPMSPMAMMMMQLAANPNNYRYATCNFNDTYSSVKGRVDLRQFESSVCFIETVMSPPFVPSPLSEKRSGKRTELIGEGRQNVMIRIQVSGLPKSVTMVERGIHIHEFGDIGDGCARVGPHFNPNQTPHGSQRNFAFFRHVGDLGNIRQSTDGLVSTPIYDQVISLEGVNNVVGRALVIKFERDDLGMGESRESRVNGNTFNPVACCTIGRTTARNWYNPMSVQQIQQMAATGVMPEYSENNILTNPNGVNPNSGNPNMGNPNMGNPNMGNPNMGNPNMGNPNMGNPNMGNPNMGNPNMGNPNMGNPNIGNPNMGGPSFNTGISNTLGGSTNFNNGLNNFNTNPGMNNNFNTGVNMNTNMNTGVNNMNNGLNMNNNLNSNLNNMNTNLNNNFNNLNNNLNTGVNNLNNNLNTNMNNNLNLPGATSTNFGTNTFIPSATSGQSFNFAGQGKKK